MRDCCFSISFLCLFVQLIEKAFSLSSLFIRPSLEKTMTSLINSLPESFLNEEFLISTDSFSSLTRDFMTLGSGIFVDMMALILPF